MRRALSFLVLSALIGAGPAVADTPATGLDRLALLLPGTWKATGQTFATQFTKAGPVDYTTYRDCWRSGPELKCVYVVNRKLQLLSIFVWDAADAIYHENQITVQGPSPVFNILVKGNVWTYDQDAQDKEGNVSHYRIVRTYTSPTNVQFTNSYSLDGKTWVILEQGTETRVDGG